ncbi:MAG TPA: glycosyltransferase [Acidimicrobiales bacterium]
MESRAPAVVAVVVTTGPAPSLGETLASLAAQDYDQISVLVLANGEAEGVEAAVAQVLPSAFVRILDENRGFAAACNEALGMVEGAAFLCFCHDDVILAPDALHLMVEEAFRSNAGVVSPKYVRPEDHSVLLHVGLNADRFGATTERIDPGEVDHGQHDTARDVFVAPGGVTLVRADLFETLGGFDDAIVALGEDLDFSWRSQVAGSRVVVAPEAVVAHHELLANGARALSALTGGHGGRTLQSLSRRNRLATMITCYGRIYVLPTVLLLVLLETGELVVAAFGRDRERIGAIVGSWRWCLMRPGRLRARHHQLKAVRRLDDHDVRRLQVAGASRLQTFGSRLVHEGMDVARGALVPATLAQRDEVDESIDHTVGFGAAFSDDASFDELDDLGRRELGITVRFLATFRTQAALVVVVAVLFGFGIRNLVASHLPLIGRLAPLDSWWTTWRHLFATWGATGVGTGAPGMPGNGVLGFAGTFVLGRMGALPRAALVLSIPIGAYGVWRLLRPVGSNRARLVGSVAFVCLSLGPNLVAGGRIDVLAALAAMPYLLRRVLVIAGIRPFALEPPHGHAPVLDPEWRTTRTGQLVILGALEAVVVALDPAAGVALVVAAIGLFLGGLCVGDPRSGKAVGVTLVSSAIAAVLLLPLTINTLAAGTEAMNVFGAPSGPWSLPGLGGLVRLAVGPTGTGTAAWLLPGAALLALVVGRAERFSTAARFTAMGLTSLAAALLVARHLTGSFAPDVSTLLVPYAVAVAVLVGTGVAAFEQDVAASQFGWRQLLSASVMVMVLVGAIPFVLSTSSGRFNLPLRGYDTEFSYLATLKTGGTRTLWLGDPRSVPLGSWAITPGLAFATSTNGLPGGGDLFVPPSSGEAHVLSDDIVAAMRDDTVHLGRLLASAGITTVVVVTATAPTLAGEQHPIQTPPPSALIPALRHQQDLSVPPGGGGVLTFTNDAARGVTSMRPQPVDPSAGPGNFGASRFWEPALDPSTLSGPVDKGTLVAALAPGGDFVATVNGAAVPRTTVYGWAPSWSVKKGTAQISLDALPLNAVLAAVVLACWLLAGLLAIGPDRLARMARRVRRAAPRGVPDEPSGTEAP